MLPGIEVGDIGPKMGWNSVGNGYLLFGWFGRVIEHTWSLNSHHKKDHVRVPLDSMLMRNSQVTTDGRYVRREGSSEKASYGTMIFVRYIARSRK